MLSTQELRSSTPKELQSELQKAKEELLKIKIGIRTKHTKDSSLKGKQKRYVAQIQTILKEIELEEAVKKAPEVEEKK